MSARIGNRLLKVVSVAHLGLLLGIVSACKAQAPTYEGTLADWQRDSATVDSLARLVPTNPLYHAYRKSLSSSDLQAAHQLIACFQFGLISRYGSFATSVAIERMKDTVWKGIEPGLIADHDARIPQMMDLAMDGEECAEADSVLGPIRGYDPIADRVHPYRRPRRLR